MPTLRVTVKGNLGEISAQSFITAISNSLIILRDLDRRLSEQRGGSTRWVVTDLATGSASVELTSRQISGKEDFPRIIADRFTNGLKYMQESHATPAYFTIDNMEIVHKMLREFVKDGASGVIYSLNDGLVNAELTTNNEPDIAKLIGTSFKAIGSIEGKVELVSLRRRSKRFGITHIRTQRAIRCNLTNDLEEDVIRAMQMRRRVVVTGIISYNEKNEPISIQVGQPIRFLKTEDELPTIQQLAGSNKWITGDMTSEEYFRSISNG